MDFRMNTMDRIEEETDPQAHPDPKPEVVDVQKQLRRLRIMDADVRKYGFTETCQRYEFPRQGKTLLARSTRHNEECRERICEALRAAGAEKLQRADMEGSERTLTHRRNLVDKEPVTNADDMVDKPTTDDPPVEPLVSMDDGDVLTTPHVNEPTNVDDQFECVRDAYDFR